MGTYYDIYTEVQLNGAWLNIDCRIMRLDGKIRIAPILSGQSWVWEMLQMLSSDTYCIPYDKLSDGTKSVFNEPGETYADSFEVVDFQTAIKDKIKFSPSRRGYVHHSHIAMFQTGEIDNIEAFLTPVDFAELDKAEQREYSYYEWDDRDGWYEAFKKIESRVNFLVSSFNDFGVPFEMYKDLNEGRLKTKDVRLVIVKS